MTMKTRLFRSFSADVPVFNAITALSHESRVFPSPSATLFVTVLKSCKV